MKSPGWLLLVFSLPTRSAAQRVEVWRKLRRFGVVALRSGGYVLPKNATNEERLQWLAAEIRRAHGQASVLQVTAIDDHPDRELVERFISERAKEYEVIAKELGKVARAKSPAAGTVSRLRRRFDEISGRDFFPGAARDRLEQMFKRLESPSDSKPLRAGREGYRGKTWVTRPRPGIDRVCSAWLIRRFIDPKATFAFAADAGTLADAIPFDMFGPRGFTHRGDDCTFETLMKDFSIADDRATAIAQCVHDADLRDGKFGRTEAAGIEQVLVGWANQGVADEELLRRGMEMVEGWFQAL